MLTPRQKRLNESRIDRAARACLAGVPIPIMETVKIFKVGEKAIAEGQDDAALAKTIRAYVETIKVAATSMSPK